jgi:hypothetical protein
MSYFKDQKESQKDVVNVLIPYSIESIIELHESALELLKMIKEKQGEVNELNNFINNSIFDDLKPKARQEIIDALEKIEMIKKAHEGLVNEITKQHGSI